jgi:ABC-type lipoprotein release transport system permease subunit
VNLHLDIALSHLRSRRRQTIVSLLGVVLGVAFFLAVSALMRGSERDLISRLVDTQPHITVSDEFRNARPQPARMLYPDAAVAIRGVKPRSERRGIRQYKQKLAAIDAISGVQAAPILAAQAIFSFAGRDEAVTLSGIDPTRMQGVSSIDDDIIAGRLDAVDANPNGIIIGDALAKKLSLAMGDTVSVVSPIGNVRTMKIVGLFRTGNASYDESQTFAQLTRVQALMNRPDVANLIIIRLNDAYRARNIAAFIERNHGLQVGVLAGSQQGSARCADDPQRDHVHRRRCDPARRLLRHLQRDLDGRAREDARHRDPEVDGLSRTRHPPDLHDRGCVDRHGRQHPRRRDGQRDDARGRAGGDQATGFDRCDQSADLLGLDQFALAASFAILSAVFAAWLPARKGGRVHPVDILRGAA